MLKAFKNRKVKIVAICLAIAVLIPAILEICFLLRSSYKAYRPDYEKIDISSIVMKERLTDEDYQTLFLQTGLTRIGIDGLIEKGLYDRIIRIQEQYFEKQDYYRFSFAPFTGYLKRSMGEKSVAEHAYLENGDILLSPTTFFSFVKIGHTSMVVDASRGFMAQASGYGSPVSYVHINHFFARPAFVILRAREVDGRAVADYTKQKLIGTEYSLLSGIFGDKAPESLKKTHCSHFIWYAYMQSGIDLDSNGGKIVTPKNIALSDNLDIVQIYGIAPGEFLSN